MCTSNPTPHGTEKITKTISLQINFYLQANTIQMQRLQCVPSTVGWNELVWSRCVDTEQTNLVTSLHRNPAMKTEKRVRNNRKPLRLSVNTNTCWYSIVKLRLIFCSFSQQRKKKKKKKRKKAKKSKLRQRRVSVLPLNKYLYLFC